MIIVITGDPKVGKTNTSLKLVDIATKLGYTCGGIITYKSPDNNIVVKDIQTNETKKLAIFDASSCSYNFQPDGFQFGNKVIERSLSTSLIVVDEIGQLESKGQGFSSILNLIKSGKIDLSIVVVESNQLPLLTEQLPDSFIFNITPDNSNSIAKEIGTILLNYIQSEREIRAHCTLNTGLK